MSLARRNGAVLGCALLLLLAAAPLAADEEQRWPSTLAGLAMMAEAAPRIIGGVPAGEGWPSVVGLLDSRITSNYAAQFCAGNLIAARWVLTAAHCVVDADTGTVTIPERLQVLAGTASLSAGGRRVRVVEVIRYPDYDRTTFDNDLALLRLAEPLALVPVRPLTADEEEALAAPGTLATVLGWGNTVVEGSAPSSELLRAEVPIVDSEGCKRSYQGSVTDNMLCAGYPEGGVDACQGDSGGPLLVPDGAGGWVQVGIVSFGTACAVPGYYGVYTRVSRAAYGEWIEGYLAQDQNPNLAPVVAVDSPDTVPAGDVVTLGMRARDDDGAIVEVSVEQIAGPAVALRSVRDYQDGALRGMTAVFVAPDVSEAITLGFRFSARDDDGVDASVEVDVVVLPRAAAEPASNGGRGGGGAWMPTWLWLLAGLGAVAKLRRKRRS